MKPPETREQMAAAARRYQDLYARLHKASKEVDAILRAMPCASVLGPVERLEYVSVAHDLAIRVWRDVVTVEAVEPTESAPCPRPWLTVVK